MAERVKVYVLSLQDCCYECAGERETLAVTDSLEAAQAAVRDLYPHLHGSGFFTWEDDNDLPGEPRWRLDNPDPRGYKDYVIEEFELLTGEANE